MKRRGTVYLLVLVTATVTVALGMLAVFAAAAQREMQELSIHRERAAARAESGIHLALQSIESDASWRSRGSRQLGSITLDRGELWVDAADADGSLMDGEDDAFTLTATATYGRAKQRVSADFEYPSGPIEAIYFPFPNVARGGGRLIVYTYQNPIPISAGGFLQPRISDLYNATTTSWIDKPDASLIEFYETLGTLIPTSLSDGGLGALYNDLEITSTGVSAGITPNSRHVYVIDGGGGDVEVVRAKLVGTLVIVNARSFTWRHPVVARPGPEGLPLIIADCDVVIRSAGPDRIDETWPDTDDIPGETDFDDPSFDGVQGIIYVDGTVTIQQNLEMRGSLIATGLVQVDDAVTIRHEAAYVESPPPGFRVAGLLRFVQGSWRRIVD